MLGSITDEVVRLAPCPVLTLSAAALDSQRNVPVSPVSFESGLPDLHQHIEVQDVHQGTVPQRLEDQADFPATASPVDKLRFLLKFAILAPSNRNTQPWLWKLNGDAVELYADTTRALLQLDPDNRELVMSCGAALLHLRVAIRHFGYQASVEVRPERDDLNLLARVRLGDKSPAAADETLLFNTIFTLHTNRQPFLEKELPAALLKELQAEARREGTTLIIVENSERRMSLINLIARGDRSQGHDQEILQETISWNETRYNRSANAIPA